MGDYGSLSLQGQLSASDEALIARYLPFFAQAVMQAENNPTNQGVLSVKTDDPKKTVKDSVYNNFVRWKTGQTPAPWIKEKPEKFIDFMKLRWAPDGASNDPKNLNQFWAPNVRSILQKNLPQDYNALQQMNMVQAPQSWRTV
jgi:hypothetical protein